MQSKVDWTFWKIKHLENHGIYICRLQFEVVFRGSQVLFFFHIFHYLTYWNAIYISFSIWVFFHEHSWFTGQQRKGEAISLTPLYHFHPLHRHLDISRVITAESSPLYLASRFVNVYARQFSGDDGYHFQNYGLVSP